MDRCIGTQVEEAHRRRTAACFFLSISVTLPLKYPLSVAQNVSVRSKLRVSCQFLLGAINEKCY